MLADAGRSGRGATPSAAARRRTIPSCPSPTTTSPCSTPPRGEFEQGARRARGGDPRSTPATRPRTRTSATSMRMLAAESYGAGAAARAGERRACRASSRWCASSPAPQAAPAAASAPAAAATTDTPRHQETLTWRSRCTDSSRRTPLAASPPLSLAARCRRWRRRSSSPPPTGDIVVELDARQGAEDGRQLPPVREGRPLRRHRLPPRHRQLHDPGRRHDAPT